MNHQLSPRDELILDVIKAAESQVSTKDFDIECQLAPASAGRSYYDRLRVAEWLIDQGMIDIVDGHLRLVRRVPPVWLIEGLEKGDPSSWRILFAFDSEGRMQGKVDHELLIRIGLEGEKEVLRQIKDHQPSRLNSIRHVSLTDDSAGYDIIAPFYDGEGLCLIEVKTCSRPGAQFRFTISRNESRVASRNPNWRLVGVQRSPSGYRLIGHMYFASFSDYLPLDRNQYGHWESSTITVGFEHFEAGLP